MKMMMLLLLMMTMILENFHFLSNDYLSGDVI